MLEAVHIDTFRMNNVLIALARSSVALVVGVEYDFIFALVGNTYSVFLPFDIRKVADNDYFLISCMFLTAKPRE